MSSPVPGCLVATPAFAISATGTGSPTPSGSRWPANPTLAMVSVVVRDDDGGLPVPQRETPRRPPKIIPIMRHTTSATWRRTGPTRPPSHASAQLLANPPLAAMGSKSVDQQRLRHRARCHTFDAVAGVKKATIFLKVCRTDIRLASGLVPPTCGVIYNRGFFRLYAISG